MMTNPAYNNALNAISPRIAGIGNYHNYTPLEDDWNYYYNNIFLPNSNVNNQLRLIFCESGPENEANYMFLGDSLDEIITTKNDKYLQQIYNGVFPHVNTEDLPTRRNALIQLAQQNVLILDLLPTHGIILETVERTIINTSPNKNIIIDLPKIIGLPFITNLDLNYVFAVPPSLYALNFIQHLLPANFIDRGNLNIGQGRVPSRNALEALIIIGLF
jgi:hypothetical protein